MFFVLSLLHHLDVVLLLPSLHLLLPALVLLEQIIQHLLQSIRVRPQCRYHILNRSFHQDSVDHAETFPILWQGLQGLEHESV